MHSRINISGDGFINLARSSVNPSGMNMVPPIPVHPNFHKNVITSDLPSSIREARLSPKSAFKQNRKGPVWEGRAKAMSDIEQQHDLNSRSDPLRMMITHINQDSRDLT
jgi:hypothetical protein